MDRVSDDDEHADPVVREFDVCLSHTLSRSTYLLQFPLHGSHAADAAELLQRTTQCRMKPHRNLMEIDLALDTKCSNYDPDSQLCSETRTLKSNAVPCRANYAIGAIRGSELHITPLHATLQMRPSFHKVDERDDRMREASGGTSDVARSPVAKKDPPGAAPQLYQVTIKRAETERTIERRQRSHAYLEREQKKEPWVSVEMNQLGSTKGVAHYKRLFTDARDQLPRLLSTEEYLNLLSPPLPTGPGVAPPKSTASKQQLSMCALREMDLEQRVSLLLRHFGVVRFDRLVVLASAHGIDQELQLIRALEKEASLVRGCWVLASSIACAGDEFFALCRDFLCVSMIESEFVDRRQFIAATGIGADMADRLFDGLAVKVSGKGFRLKLLEDTAFCLKHSDIVARHTMGWLAKAPGLRESVSARVSVLPDLDIEVHASSGANPQRGDISNGEPESDRRLRDILETHGLITTRYALQHVGAECDLERLALKVGEGYCLKTTADEVVDRFRDVVLELFQANSSLRKADINAHAIRTLGAAIPAGVYTKIMKELALPQGQKWVLKAPKDL